MSTRITNSIRPRLGHAIAEPPMLQLPVQGMPDDGSCEWSVARRLWFRFAFAYLLLYNFPLPVNIFPPLGIVGRWTDGFWERVVLWTGGHVLHLAKPIAVAFNGSGDTTFSYVQLLCQFVFALSASVVWSVVAKRREYDRLYDWLRVYVRYVLGAIMLGYGAMKVVKAQFPDAGPERLMEPVGDMSPMGLLWTFMGYSYVFNVFTGLGEMLGGVLLFFRRTTLAGALLLVAVLGNVVVLNYTYDVPVKLFSTNLLLMTLYVLLPDVKRLIDFFVLHRPTVPRPLAMSLSPGWKRGARLALKTLYVPLVIWIPLRQAYRGRHEYGDAAPKPPIHGIYEVEAFVRNGTAIAPLVTDSTRWRRVFVGRRGVLSVRFMNDSLRRFTFQRKDSLHRLTIASRADSTSRGLFSFVRPDSGHVVLDGVFRGDSVHIELRHVDEARFLLVSRGFHWINEVPFNR